jgi:uncharacterized integral membrane protein
MLLSLTAGFVLGIAALVFAAQNNDFVSLSFFGWQFESSLAVVTTASVLLGILICALLSIPNAIKSAMRTYSLKKENSALRDQVARTEQTVVVEEVIQSDRSAN